MRVAGAVVGLCVAATIVSAQPAPTQASFEPGYQADVDLTVDEQWLLDRGYINDGEWIGGGTFALVVGFGIGHVVQGRWRDGGYKFTLGEVASFWIGLWGVGRAMGCVNCNDTATLALAVGGSVGFIGFRIWSTLDAFLVPPRHNRKLRLLQQRLGIPVPNYTLAPYIAPPRDGDGAVAGLSLRF